MNGHNPTQAHTAAHTHSYKRNRRPSCKVPVMTLRAPSVPVVQSWRKCLVRSCSRIFPKCGRNPNVSALRRYHLYSWCERLNSTYLDKGLNPYPRLPVQGLLWTK